MKAFAYEAPTKIDEAVALLADGSRNSLPLAGGTDLLVQLRHGARSVDLLVDVKRIPELNRLVFDPGEGLTVGAVVPCARLDEDAAVREHYPALVDAVSIIGGPAIRERATLGGNLCNAAPSADSVPVMIVLGAACTLAGPGGARTVPVETFCTAPGETVLEPGELLVALRFPPPAPGSGAAYVRFTPRREMDIAVVGAGARVSLSDDRATIADACIALAAVGPTPLLAAAAGAALTGRAADEDAFAAAAEAAQEAVRPIDDVRGTAAQRRHLAGVLVKRALRTAVARARED